MYTRSEQFEPLMPRESEAKKAGLPALAGDVAARALALKGRLHPATEARLAELLRSVYSYYSNRIEGQHTHPHDIEQALKQSYSKEPDKARRQRVAIAHIEAQKEMEGWLGHEELDVYAPAFLARLHEAFYRRLKSDEGKTDEGERIVPGAWRDKDVKVGRHVPPAHKSVAAFLQRAHEFYGDAKGLDGRLIACACAHHRLAWVHPFLDGNGRVMRLHSQAVLLNIGIGSGLWAVSRGFARNVETYYARLGDADSARRGDLDGRGNLSEAGLISFAKYFLETCLDQVTFMGEMLSLDNLRARLRGYLILRSQHDKSIRTEAELPLYHLFLAGEVTRGEFKQMTGLASRTADTLLAALLKAKLVESETPKGALRFGLPMDALGYYFPRLYPEAVA